MRRALARLGFALLRLSDRQWIEVDCPACDGMGDVTHDADCDQCANDGGISHGFPCPSCRGAAVVDAVVWPIS